MNNCICEVCGLRFWSIKKNTKTCSKKCCDKRYTFLHKEELKLYRLKNKDKTKIQRAKHYQDNIEKERQNSKKWYQRNRKSEIQKNREYRKQNRELFHWYHNRDRFGGMRKIILNRDKNQCRACGSKKVCIHHKDGTGWTSQDGLYSLNNDIKNLITLCNSCHHILHHYQKRIGKIIHQDENIVRSIRKLIANKKTRK